MCKSQRDIEVEQQRQWRASKKERDSIKMMHNAMNLQPPHSPISPSPPEVENPSVDARMQGYQDAGYFEQYGHIFHPDFGATSSPAPGEGVFGSFTSFGAAGASGSAPFLLQPLVLTHLELQVHPPWLRYTAISLSSLSSGDLCSFHSCFYFWISTWYVKHCNLLKFFT